MLLPYGRQSINDDDIKAVSAALRGDIITRGAQVEAFEKAFADYVDAKYAVAFSSGSSALACAYQALDAGPSDRVLTTPNTFIATVAKAAANGANIVFIDIDRNSGNIDLEKLEPNLEYRSIKGRLFIAPVHFSGIAVDMKKLSEMAKASNIVIIEDAAHAIGSLYPSGEKVGCSKYSDMTIFSFHPVKTMTTGEGGMVTTNNPDLYEKLKFYRNSGISKETDSPSWHYEVKAFSTVHHMTDFQAALGLSQLKRLDAFIEKRRALVTRYRERLKTLKLFDPTFDAFTSFHLFVVQVKFPKGRTEFMETLKKEGIGTQLHYIPLYQHPVFKEKIGDIKEYFPEMEQYYKEALSLPLYYDLSFEEVDRVCDILLAHLS